MSEEPHADEPDPQQGSVFGNLPGSRPGTRSPRRDRGSRGEPKAAARAAEAAPEAAARKRPAASPEAESPAAEPADGATVPQAPSGGGLEDLAWAGVAAAAEAATLGVRLASRAIEALRDGVDRR